MAGKRQEEGGIQVAFKILWFFVQFPLIPWTASMGLRKFLRRSSSGGFLCVVVFTLCVLFKRTSREPSPRLTRGETRLAEKHCPNLLETFRGGADGDYYDCSAGQKGLFHDSLAIKTRILII